MKIKSITCVFGAAALLLSGCVNHVRDITDVKKEIDRRETSRKYYVALNPAVPTDTQFSATIEKTENFETNIYEISIGKKYYIPYSGWRELYEIPLGFCLLPCSIISHVGWLLCLGIWDYDFTWDITCKSFAGMNPCINWETEARTVEEVSSASKKLLKTEKETKKTMLAKTPVTLKAGNLSKTYITDDFGNFTVFLLSLNPEEIFFPLDRKISFFPSGEKTSAKDIVLQREFITKLLTARDMINNYMIAPTGKRLVQTLNALEKSGFAKLAYELETREKKRHATNQFFMKEFRNSGGEL